MELDAITGHVVDAAMRVHSVLGPGLLERAYITCLAIELTSRGLRIAFEHPVDILYGGHRVEGAFRIDLLVEERVVVEGKTVFKLTPLNEAQILSHLRLGGFEAGLLINFHALHLRDGIRRFRNGFS